MRYNHPRLLERFLRYVQIDTTAREDAGAYPSSSGQLELGALLVRELKELGIADAEQDAHGIVMASLPGTTGRSGPVVAFCAHLDTSPETSGTGVRPQVFRNYEGGDLVLPGDQSQVIRVVDNPELRQLLDKTIITSDGTTLLGADDKAGLAVIMETAACLLEQPQLEHGLLRLCFTCDEEIGCGVDHVDLKRLGADVCYTLDGHGADFIDVETFSADLAVATVRGVNIHPSIGKGKMVNAVRAAAALIDRLPRDGLSPESTAGREGFLHPYVIEGGGAEVKVRILLRDFDTAALTAHATLLRDAATAVMHDFPRCRIDVNIRPQYRNMAEGLSREPRAVAYAEQALRQLGRIPKLSVIRGGTDGSRLTELGLPTPNLSTGEHNPHSPLEWTCLEEMGQAVEGLLALSEIWGRE